MNDRQEKKKSSEKKGLKSKRGTSLRPAGYFADCYTEEEIRDDNLLAKASVVRAPSDLE